MLHTIFFSPRRRFDEWHNFCYPLVPRNKRGTAGLLHVTRPTFCTCCGCSALTTFVCEIQAVFDMDEPPSVPSAAAYQTTTNKNHPCNKSKRPSRLPFQRQHTISTYATNIEHPPAGPSNSIISGPTLLQEELVQGVKERSRPSYATSELYLVVVHVRCV